jgi:hypothetical protein
LRATLAAAAGLPLKLFARFSGVLGSLDVRQSQAPFYFFH